MCKRNQFHRGQSCSIVQQPNLLEKNADWPIWVWVQIYIIGGYSLVLKSKIGLSLIFFSWRKKSAWWTLWKPTFWRWPRPVKLLQLTHRNLPISPWSPAPAKFQGSSIEEFNRKIIQVTPSNCGILPWLTRCGLGEEIPSDSDRWRIPNECWYDPQPIFIGWKIGLYEWGFPWPWEKKPSHHPFIHRIFRDPFILNPHMTNDNPAVL